MAVGGAGRQGRGGEGGAVAWGGDAGVGDVGRSVLLLVVVVLLRGRGEFGGFALGVVGHGWGVPGFFGALAFEGWFWG